MPDPIISPDGKMMWTGKDWIPLPGENSSTSSHSKCENCDSTNVRIMKCKSENCDGVFCEICNSHCRFQKKSMDWNERDLFSRFKKDNEYSIPFHGWEPQSEEVISISPHHRLEKRSEEVKLKAFNSIIKSKCVHTYRFDDGRGDGPYCNECISIQNEDTQKELIQEFNEEVDLFVNEKKVEADEKQKRAAEQKIANKESRLSELREEYIHSRRMKISVTIGTILIILTSFILVMTTPEGQEPLDDIESGSTQELIFVALSTVATVPCCLIPIIIFLGSGGLGLDWGWDNIYELKRLNYKSNEERNEVGNWKNSPQILLVDEAREALTFGHKVLTTLKTNHKNPISIKIIEHGFKKEYQVNDTSETLSGKFRWSLRLGRYIAKIDLRDESFVILLKYSYFSFNNEIKKVTIKNIETNNEIEVDLENYRSGIKLF